VQVVAPRRREPPQLRLDQVLGAATSVFAVKGLRRTQMADVARAAGVSAGSLYNYVANKETLFGLVVERGMGDPVTPEGFPVPARTLSQTAAWLRTRLDFEEFSELWGAAQRGDPYGPDELEVVVAELFDVIAQTADAVEVIDASAADAPEVAAVVVEARAAILRNLVRFLERGPLRGSADAAAYLVLESATWMARKRLRDPSATGVDDPTARAVLVHVLTNGLLPDEGR